MKSGAGLNMLPMLLPNYHLFRLGMMRFMMLNYSVVNTPYLLTTLEPDSVSLSALNPTILKENIPPTPEIEMGQIMRKDPFLYRRSVILVSFVLSIRYY